jgi:cytochrome c oxidase cbb3-type subunit 4
MIGNVSYQDAVTFAQSWGAVYFVLMFVVAFAYALWPSNAKRFRDAASSLFREDDAP